MMNSFFKFNMFVRVWKVVEVICVFKDGDVGSLCDNRFILLLLVLFKVNERLVYRLLVTFLDNDNKLL